MNMTKPCVYHYLFSHIPSYSSEDEAKETAENLVFRLRTDLRLQRQEMQHLRQLPAGVTLLSFLADEHTDTYLSQLLSHDLISTILTYNQTETHEGPLLFLQRKSNANFPETSDRIGETSVFFVQAALDTGLVKQIADTSNGTENEESFPCCQFEWGTLYALQHSAQSCDSRQKVTYVLLVPKEEDLKKGDHFLSYSFPILESIRHKLIFERQEAHKFKTKNILHEQKIKSLLDKINSSLSKTDQHSSFEDDLKQVDIHQSALYQSIAKTDALLLTLDINLVNFKNTLSVLSLVEDALFTPMLLKFHFIHNQIEYDLRYIKFLLPGMDKREELLRLRIDWQRKEIEKRSNMIKEVTNALIFAFGVALGIGQMLLNYQHLDLRGKFFVMVLGGSFAYAFDRFIGTERIKTIWEALGWPGKVKKQLEK